MTRHLPVRALAACLVTLAAGQGQAQAQSHLQLQREDGRTVVASAYTPVGPCRGIALVSHGAGGSEKGYAYLGRALAQWGFLAVVPAHADSGLKALREKTPAFNVREGLTELVADADAYRSRFADLQAARSWAAAHCASPRSVLLGHSMGAATTMLEAGATNHLGLQGTDRYDAYVALSPQGEGSIFPADAWKNIRKPVLLLTGTRDQELGGKGWQSRTAAYAVLPGPCKWLAVIDGATHMHFAGHGASRTTEALTLQTLAAFLATPAAGACPVPPAASPGLTLQTP